MRRRDPYYCLPEDCRVCVGDAAEAAFKAMLRDWLLNECDGWGIGAKAAAEFSQTFKREIERMGWWVRDEAMEGKSDRLCVEHWGEVLMEAKESQE